MLKPTSSHFLLALACSGTVAVIEEKMMQGTWMVRGVSAEHRKMAKAAAAAAGMTIGEWLENLIFNFRMAFAPQDGEGEGPDPTLVYPPDGSIPLKKGGQRQVFEYDGPGKRELRKVEEPPK
jgi:hypothetical protein